MKTTAFKTTIIFPGHDLLAEIIKTITPHQEKLEGSVLVVTSKVVSLAENSIVPIGEIDKKELVHREADRYIHEQQSKYGVTLTIKNSILAVNAGIDESNVDGVYVLLPKNSYDSAAWFWQQIKKHFQLSKFGVIITDSTTLPLKWGVVGRSLAHCGFVALNDLRGEPDIFGRPLVVTQVNVAEGVAAAAVLEMGEGANQTPLCLVEEVPDIRFQAEPPTKKEISELLIDPEEDVYSPVILSAQWKVSNS